MTLRAAINSLSGKKLAKPTNEERELVALFLTTIEEVKRFATTFLNQTTQDDYVLTTEKTLTSILSLIHRGSRFADNVNDPLEVVYSIDDHQYFSAYVKPVDHNTISTYISLGVLWCLQDITFRALSSENFFNAQVNDFEYSTRWPGCDCYVPIETVPPTVRYWDYTPTPYNPDPQLLEIWSKFGISFPSHDVAPWIGRFIKKLPFDSERLPLAALIQQIALTWIVIHEEAHFRLGHLAYLSEAKARGEKIPDEMRQAFEFQADKDATQAVAKIYFRRSIQEGLPDYASQDWSWLLRLLMTSIGLVIVIMDIGRRYNGYAASYPLPRIRFLTMTRHLFKFAHNRNKDPKRILHDGDLVVDSRYGLNDVSRELIAQNGLNDVPRELIAQAGSLWDITQIQQVIESEETALSSSDPLWPLNDAFPLMANTVIYCGPTNWRDLPAVRSKLVSVDENLATTVSANLGIPRKECLRYRDIAQQWVDEANTLVHASITRYRDITNHYRCWEVNE